MEAGERSIAGKLKVDELSRERANNIITLVCKKSTCKN